MGAGINMSNVQQLRERELNLVVGGKNADDYVWAGVAAAAGLVTGVIGIIGYCSVRQGATGNLARGDETYQVMYADGTQGRVFTSTPQGRSNEAMTLVGCCLGASMFCFAGAGFGLFLYLIAD